NENYATAFRASHFLEIASEHINDKLIAGVIRRLKPLNTYNYDEAKDLLVELSTQAQKLHETIKEHYVNEFEKWLEREKLHPLQAIVLQKQITHLKESHV
ncbi:MAG: hypothetical protein PHU29_08165, partial [Sulfuricurvum sp.]|nr:hypothetical protein [Sulfuricurvum sp.]